MAMIENLEALLENGTDNSMLRFGLGNAYLKAGDMARAAEHLRVAIAHDPGYSAAWKSLGRALMELGQPAEAARAYRDGIAAAEAKGDKQAAKEMTVFLRRVERSTDQ
jgi:Tfp pilus assembly protein PilF